MASAALLALLMPYPFAAVSVKGNEYPDAIRMGGKTLRLVGAGLRGKEFADLLWSCYCGDNSCCPGLKTQILPHCSN